MSWSIGKQSGTNWSKESKPEEVENVGKVYPAFAALFAVTRSCCVEVYEVEPVDAP